MHLRYSFFFALAAALLWVPASWAQTLTADLSGDNQVPPVTTTATGTVAAVIDGTSLVVTGTFSGLESDYNSSIGSHLHGAPAGSNGGVVVVLSPTLDSDNRGGTFEEANNTFTIRETFADSLRNGLVYVNIHTTGNPSGELRGQLVPPVQTLTADLSGDNQVPPVTTTATGTVAAVIDGDLSSLVVTGTFSGLESDYNSNIGSHLHGAPAGSNGGVVIALSPTLDSDNRGGTFEEANNTFTIRRTFADSLRNGLVYVNIHTTGNPSGELRGQLVPPVRINELRVDQGGADDDEYIELKGAAGTSLDGHTLVVIGDGSAGQGVIESVLSLDGEVIPDDGLFLIAENTFTLGTADLVGNLNFENGQSSTFLLVDTFTGSDGDDLDTDDDGTPDSAPWTSVVDAVGILSTETDDLAYGAALGFTDVGPNGNFSPAQVYRDGTTGLVSVGAFDFLFDTPGAENASTARVQVIHNAPDPAADIVDVYINGIRLLNDLAFQEATGFVNLPAGLETTVDVTGSSAEDNSSPVFSVTLAEGLPASSTLQLIASGVLDTTPENDADDTEDEFTLLIGADAQEASSEAGKVDVRVVHGSPDAPPVDVRSGGSILVDDAAYTAITGYIPLDPASYILDITTEDGGTTVESFDADLSGAAGAAVTVLASGFLDPSDDGDNAPGFGLLVVFADGTTAGLAVGAEEDARAAGMELRVQNPIANSARVQFDAGVAGDLQLDVYDALGRRVASLAEGTVAPGVQSVTFDASGLAAGVYVFRLSSEAGTLTQTVTVVR